MISRRSICGLTAVLVVCLTATAVNAQTVLIGPGVNNGSFEDPVITTAEPAYNYEFGTPTGWFDRLVIQNSPNGTYSVASDGNQGVAISTQGDGTPTGNCVKTSILLEEVYFEADTIYTLNMDVSSNTSASVMAVWWLSDPSGTHKVEEILEATNASTQTWEAVAPIVVDTTVGINDDFIGKVITVGVWNGTADQLWVDNISLVATSTGTPDPIPGDFNLDDSVNVTDLGILATNYGIIGGMEWGDGDATGDHNVDVADLGILATHYGESRTVAAVPEPTALSLLVLGALAMLPFRRR